MKKIYILFILSNFYLSNAQKTIVRYENHSKNNDNYISFLVFDKQRSIEIPSYINKYKTFEDLLNDKTFIESPKFIRNIKKDSILSHTFLQVVEIPMEAPFVTRDNVEKINWKIGTKIFKILNYKCSIATGKFRGRNYKVWFTREIPIPFGPWKLGGLPGLIMKVDVDEGSYTFQATNITLNSNLKVPEKYANFYESNSKVVIPYKNYITAQNKYYENLIKMEKAKIPNGDKMISPPVRDNFIEKSFVWSEK